MAIPFPSARWLLILEILSTPCPDWAMLSVLPDCRPVCGEPVPGDTGNTCCSELAKLYNY